MDGNRVSGVKASDKPIKAIGIFENFWSEGVDAGPDLSLGADIA